MNTHRYTVEKLHTINNKNTIIKAFRGKKSDYLNGMPD